MNWSRPTPTSACRAADTARRGALPALLLIAVCGTQTSAPSASAAGAKVPDVEELVLVRRLQAVQIAPDGARVALIVEEPNDEGHSKDPTPTHLWVADVAGGEVRPYTRLPSRAFAPQWSPDSRTIAFLSVRPGAEASQIYLIEAGGGTARQLTHQETPVGMFTWSPDGKKIAFLAQAAGQTDAATRRRIALGYDPLDLGPSEPVARARPTGLWVVDVATGKAEPANVGGLHVMAAQWSPAGGELLLTAANNTTPDEQQLRPRLVTVDGAGGGPVPYCRTSGKLMRASWSPDGRGVAFLGSLANGSDFYPGGLFVCRGRGERPRDVVAGSAFAVENMCWAADGQALLATVMQGTHRSLAIIRADGTIKHRTAAPWEVSFRSDFSVSPATGRIACVLSQSDRPPDAWVLESDGRSKQLTHLNPALEQRSFGKGEAVPWTADDGWEITGVLVRPVGYRPGRRYPLVVHVHGSNVGDANDFHVSPSHWAQLLATRGYAVLLPNYRGSLTGPGKFRRGARGDFGGKDLRDVLAGVDALVRQGVADPDRLGISGISYGGYLTARAVTQTARFKAAVMASGISNWFALHTGQTAAPESAARLEWDRSPFDAAALLWDRSPSAHVRDVKTPTLILWGEHDIIPVAQALEFSRGLRHYKVPSQLIVYPREGHVIRETNHLKDQYQRILDWFGKWLAAR